LVNIWAIFPRSPSLGFETIIDLLCRTAARRVHQQLGQPSPVFAIAFVWLSEAMNTALEFLADEVSEEKRERIGKSKDIAAFGVLASAAAAIVIGGIVFLPHLFKAG